MRELTEKDRARVQDVETRIAEVGAQMGYNRETFLQREQTLLSELTRLRAERTDLVNMMAREYLGDEDPEHWQYNASTMTFERS